MSRYAVISDIHGNLHALQAVYARLGELEVDEVICLGDIVGYGPDPAECLDLVVKHCSIIVQGNHDQAAVDLHQASGFNGAAREAVYWTRDRLGPLHLNALNGLREVQRVGESVLCIHDCPVPGPSDYVHDHQMAALAFQDESWRICLLGHTHVPMVFETLNPSATSDGTHGAWLSPTDITAFALQDGSPITLREDHRYICNPGSVGQPRDCDPRASFAVLDLVERSFTVHREEYDIDGAQLASHRAGLPAILADRLAIGA